MKLRQPQRRERPENVTPLINVVFLLLIFFMMAGQLSRSDPFPLSPPSSASEREPAKDPATLYVAADGRISVGGQTVKLAGLADAVAEARGAEARGADTGRLRLKADARADAARVVAVMDRLREAGVERIDMLTVRGGG
ncbi:outer membrane transport energization protein ExbD [Limimonas halophila]|uniref:Outer membrane transport energization protein ExbD n=1 Tax=Limimonas halophila TaxID=1082479 RepID=A0A1G7KZP5_9PROT|nr:biopolymer transporter ExbD [Limimonas halophila]SDF42544.1 outer membrane transport energization protein ExbD [Limimonas halophila]